MASRPEGGEEPLSLRHGVRCEVESSAAVEEVLLSIGEQIGYENISSASRMNKAVVVFLKEENLVNRLVSSGISVSGLFVAVSPLANPTRKVIISNVPPFIPDDEIERALSCFGKFASPLKTIPLGCKNTALKHVMANCGLGNIACQLDASSEDCLDVFDLKQRCWTDRCVCHHVL